MPRYTSGVYGQNEEALRRWKRAAFFAMSLSQPRLFGRVGNKHLPCRKGPQYLTGHGPE